MTPKPTAEEVSVALAYFETPGLSIGASGKVLARHIRHLESRQVLMEAALAPFAVFAENDGEFIGKGDELYVEHAKVKAVLRRSDCLAAKAALDQEAGK